MLKKLAAIGLGAALILSPVVTMAQTTPATDTTAAPAAAAPAATPMKPMKPMAHKVKHKVKAKHVVKKPAVKKPAVKKPAPAAAPAEAPKS
jgi:rod shape-determining protein MreC